MERMQVASVFDVYNAGREVFFLGRHLVEEMYPAGGVMLVTLASGQCMRLEWGSMVTVRVAR